MKEVGEIKSSLDVLVVGMNPSLSQRTYKQLYDRLKKRDGAKGLLDVLGQLSEKAKQDFVESIGNEALWNQWVEEAFPASNANEEALSKLQYYFVEGKEKPESHKISWPVVRKEDDPSKCKTITYFDTIRRTLAAGLKAMESNSQKSELTWYQIDLFHDRQTDQKAFLESLEDGQNKWNPKAQDAVLKFWEKVEALKPRVLLVANSNVSDLIFTNYDDVLKETFNFGSGTRRQGFGKTLSWDHKSVTFQIDPEGSEQMPQVIFSRQLSGGASNSMLYFVAKEIGRMLSPSD
jgi:hypothetical protein